MEKKRNDGFVPDSAISGFIAVCAMALFLSAVPVAAIHGEESSVHITSADKDAGKINGFLFKPDSGSGPFPAVVAMHGGGGVHGWTFDFASTISGWGYVALVIDSYGNRNIRSTEQIGHATGAFHQLSDVYGARRFLSKLDFVDSKRMAIMDFPPGAAIPL